MWLPSGCIFSLTLVLDAQVHLKLSSSSELEEIENSKLFSLAILEKYTLFVRLKSGWNPPKASGQGRNGSYHNSLVHSHPYIFCHFSNQV